MDPAVLLGAGFLLLLATRRGVSSPPPGKSSGSGSGSGSKLPSLTGLAGEKPTYAARAGVQSTDFDPFMWCLPGEILRVFDVSQSGDPNSYYTSDNFFANLYQRVFVQKDLKWNQTYAGHGDDLPDNYYESGRNMRQLMKDSLYLQFYATPKLIPLSTIDDHDIAQAVNLLAGKLPSYNSIPTAEKSQNLPLIPKDAEREAAGETVLNTVGGLLSAVTFGVSAIAAQGIDAGLMKPDIAAKAATETKERAASIGGLHVSDALDHLDRYFKLENQINDGEGPVAPFPLVASDGAHFWILPMMFAAHVNTAADLDAVGWKSGNGTMMPSWWEFRWMADALEGGNAMIIARVDARARIYRALDVLRCIYFPDTDGVKAPKPFRYYYVSKKWGPMLGSIFPPQKEDVQIAGPAYTTQTAVSSDTLRQLPVGGTGATTASSRTITLKKPGGMAL